MSDVEVAQRIQNGIDKAKRSWPCVCCGGIIGFISFILFASSFKSVGPYHWALKKNTISKRVNLDGPDAVFMPGVYFVGFWNSFETFPSTIQTIVYSYEGAEEGVQSADPLNVRSRDKVTIHMEVSVQYQRKKETLVDLYREAMSPVLQENIFMSKIRAELTKVMARYDAADCWKNRPVIINSFKEACDRVLAEAHVNCWGLQFYRSHTEDKYENELIKTQVQKQRERIEQAKLRSAEVRSQTQVVLAAYRRNITELVSRETAKRYNIQLNATAFANAAKVSAEATALSYTKDALRLNNGTIMSDEQLAKYQRALMLGSSLTESHLFYGFAGSPDYIAVPGNRRLQADAGQPQGSQRRLATKPQQAAPQGVQQGTAQAPPKASDALLEL